MLPRPSGGSGYVVEESNTEKARLDSMSSVARPRGVALIWEKAQLYDFQPAQSNRQAVSYISLSAG